MYHIIVNPASRSGKGLKIWQKCIEPELKARKVSYLAYFSGKAGDVAVLAHKITSGTDAKRLYLIILGGDGTVNEALQGIVFSKNLIIGYIPTGSSNDLARDLSIPKNPRKALDKILFHGKATPMDIGLLTFPQGRRYFAVSCGIGFDAAVCEEALHSRIKTVLNKIGLGKLTYLGIALKQLIAAKSNSCEIYLDGMPPILLPSLFFSASMIHRYEGGGFQFCPQADYRDGLLDVCTVGKLKKPMLLLALPTAFFGKHYMFRNICHYRTREITIHTALPLCLHTDGEIAGHASRITVECQKEKLLLIQ